MFCSRAEGGDRDDEGTQVEGSQKIVLVRSAGPRFKPDGTHGELNHSGRCSPTRWLKLSCGFPLAS